MAKTMNKRSGYKHKRTARKGPKCKGKKSTRGYRKGSKSKTMKGKKDFTTKKSSKVFNRRRHYQKHAKGSRVIRRPYHRKGGRSNTTHYKPDTHKPHTHKPTTARRLAATPGNPAGRLQANSIVTQFRNAWANVPGLKKGETLPYNTKGIPSAKAAIAKLNNLDITTKVRDEAIGDIHKVNGVYNSVLQTKWEAAYAPDFTRPFWEWNY